MEGKETVMKELVYDSGLVVKFSITDRDIAETQAEISFEAGLEEAERRHGAKWHNYLYGIGKKAI